MYRDNMYDSDRITSFSIYGQVCRVVLFLRYYPLKARTKMNPGRSAFRTAVIVSPSAYGFLVNVSKAP